jgi:K+-transporting ATPase ATPase A chain
VSGWNLLQLAVLVVAVGVTAPILGGYLARVLGGGAAPGDRFFRPLERALYRLGGVDPAREQPWSVYALSLLAFSLVSVVGLYLLQRVQGALLLNPTDVAGVPSALAFNTAASFVTNTNWQNYGGESTMSHLTQMSGLAVQNFVSAAVGIAVAVALVRGMTRSQSETISRASRRGFSSRSRPRSRSSSSVKGRFRASAEVSRQPRSTGRPSPSIAPRSRARRRSRS